ncbi:MAG: hypothetical protein IID38_03970 [Planctomycetes bacterium]|nr:hypothetical protein [Planctomycetota bacterium]
MDRYRKTELALTRDQVRRIDHLATHRYGITGLVLMENAGRHAAQIITQRFGPTGSAWICCGTGNNGGDGFVIARHLHNDGWGEITDPEAAADAVAASWGFAKPVTW